jgi:hypothetical protein
MLSKSDRFFKSMTRAIAKPQQHCTNKKFGVNCDWWNYYPSLITVKFTNKVFFNCEEVVHKTSTITKGKSHEKEKLAPPTSCTCSKRNHSHL